jgi:hypothetical protein
MGFRYQQYIDGEWTNAISGRTWDVINPATEECHSADATIAAMRSKQPIGRSPTGRVARRTTSARFCSAPRPPCACRRPGGADHRDGVRQALVQARGEWLVAGDLFDWFAEKGKRGFGF